MKRLVASSVILMLLAASSATLQEPVEGATKEERVASIEGKVSSEYFKLGEWLESKKMYEWARGEYNRAITFNKRNEKAQAKLGNAYDAVKDEFAFDPELAKKSKVLTGGNEKTGDDAKKIRQDFEKKLQSMGKTMAQSYASLGAWCEKNKDVEGAKAAYQSALGYDPTNSAARKGLGYVKDKDTGRWVSGKMKEILQKLKDGLTKAPSGSESSEQTQFEKDLGLSHTKRRSDRFLVESGAHQQQDLADLIQHGEHAYAIWEDLLDKGVGESGIYTKEAPFHTLILKDKGLHDAFIDRYSGGGSPKQIEFSKKSRGHGSNPQETYHKAKNEDEQDLTLPSLEDFVIHGAIQNAMTQSVGGGNLWTIEGMAYWFTKNMKQTAVWSCVNLAGTGSGGSEKNFQDPKNWELLVKTMVEEGEDANIFEVLKCENFAEFSAEETVKGWSLVDFLIAEHRDKYIDLLDALRAGAAGGDGLKGTVEEALDKIFQWSVEDFDAKWRLYVRANY